MAKIGMVSLGCPKNQVDAERMLSMLRDAGYEITGNEQEADAIIVNTCGFIEDAKRESIDNIFELAQLKDEGSLKALVVTGCMAERYREQIRAEMPEVDAVVGIGGNKDIAQVLDSVLGGTSGDVFGEKSALSLEGGRILTTPSYTAYLKIAEGCDNCCSYCAIPMIRGRYRSRTVDSILAEAQTLAQSGVRELIVIAQDTTRYGEDLAGRSLLPELLLQLEKIEGLRWIRILYTYPERISDELLDVMAGSSKIVHYLDMPVQHCNEDILSAMNRKGSRASLEALIAKIREKMPDITLRTTLIAGFPGESEEQFNELAEFAHDMQFDRLGCFAYSPEEGTKAAGFPGQLDEQTKQDRADIIMRQQTTVVEKKNHERIGRVLEVLVEGYDTYIKCFFGRSAADAPEIDGKVFFTCPSRLCEGDFVRVLITDTIDYDLLGETVAGEEGCQ